MEIFPCWRPILHHAISTCGLSPRTIYDISKTCCLGIRYCKQKHTKSYRSRFIGVRTCSTQATVHEVARQSEMKRYLSNCKIPFEKGFTCWRFSFPVTSDSKSSPTSSYLTNPATIFVNMTTGMFIDYDRRLSGPWKVFQDLTDKWRNRKAEPFSSTDTESDVFLSNHKYEELQDQFDTATKVGDLSSQEFNSLCHRFDITGLQLSTFKLFDVRVSKDRNSLIFPYHDPCQKISGIKTIQVVVHNEQKEFLETFFPVQSPLSVFGSLSGGNKSKAEVVIVGSPLDAMCITQETNLMAVAFPRKQWPLAQEVLPWFENFHRVTLWLGETLQDWEAVKSMSRKLGLERCFFIRPTDGSQTPLRMMQKKLSVLKTILGAQPMSHKFVTSFHALKTEVLQELMHTEQVTGIQWRRFPALNKLLKGHRRGELTIFTGPTGSGKTTFMSEYSLDLCMQGVITLWGSFEIKNVRLAKMMITQFSMLPLETNLDKFDQLSEQFQQLPLYFLTLHGQQNISQVLDVMSHAVYVHDIQHVIVDNLQFMIGMDENMKVDRFFRQDLVVAAFRKFATQNYCHVTLVMHPRKENDTDELTLNSIAGGAKASQEADSVMILQDRRLNMLKGRKYLQVAKNRFDGDIGLFPLEFDKDTKSYSMKKKSPKAQSATESKR